MKKILYVNHGQSNRCGVYDLGLRHYLSIANMDEYDIIYREIDTIASYFENCQEIKPDGIIFNYMTVTSPWINGNINLYKCKKYCVPHLFFPNDFSFQEDPSRTLFDYFIILDKNSEETNTVFKTDRPLTKYNSDVKEKNIIPRIGSFGFGFKHKMMHIITHHINECFDEAEIYMHTPKAHFSHGDEGPEIIRDCTSQITKPGIKIYFSNQFLPEMEVIQNLNKNDINCLFYSEYASQGISSSLDYLVSAQKPIMITNSKMFRSFSSDLPNYPQTSLKEIYNHFDQYRDGVTSIYNLSINKIKQQTKEIFDRTI